MSTWSSTTDLEVEQVRTRWWGVIVAAGILAAGGCGGGVDGQLGASSSSAAADKLDAGFDKTLGAPYRLRTTLSWRDANGGDIPIPAGTMPAECRGAVGGPTTQISTDPRSRLTVLEDPASGEPVAMIDRASGTAFLARARFADPSIVTAPWVRVTATDRGAIGATSLTLDTGLSTAASSLLNVEPGPPYQAVRQSTREVVEVGAEDIDATATTHLRSMLDEQRYNDLLREQVKKQRVGGPTGTLPDPAPERKKTFDAWLAADGTLRRTQETSAMQQSTPPASDPPPTPTTQVTTSEYSAVGTALPAIPTGGDVADLGSQPAAVLLPRPGCAAALAVPSAPGQPNTPEMDAWMACQHQSDERAVAGKTVEQYVAATQSARDQTTGASTVAHIAIGDWPTTCPQPSAGGLPAGSGGPDGVLSLVPPGQATTAGTIPPR